MPFGDGDAWMRLPAVFFGVAALLTLYFLGRRLAGAPAALMACLIMAVAVPELDHSQEARMYTMGSMLTLASLYSLVEWVQKRSWWALVLSILFAYSAFLTTPTVIAGLLLAGMIGWLSLVYRRNWAAAVATLIGYALLLTAWWPLQRYARLALEGGSLSWIPRPPPFALVALHSELLTYSLGAARGTEPSQWFQVVVQLLGLVLVAAALFGAWRRQLPAQQAVAVAAWFYTIAGGLYAMSVLKEPVWVLRYFHYAAPALYLLLGIGIVCLGRSWRPAGWAAGVVLVGLTGVAAIDYYRLPVREDWRGAAVAVAHEATGEDIVAVIGLPKLFERYYRGRAPICEISPRLSEMTENTNAVLTDLLGQIPAHAGRTWIVIREDPRFESIAFLERFDCYLRQRGKVPRIQVFRTVQGKIDLILLRPSTTVQESL